MSLFISQAYRRRLESAVESPIPAGRLMVADAHAARQLAAWLAAAEDGSQPHLGRMPTAGELAALALLDDAYRKILDRHLARREATLLQRVLTVLRVELGAELLDRLLLGFAEEFLGARMNGLSLLAPSSEERREEGLDRALVLQEILIFWLLESNPAARPVVGRFHVSPLLGIPAFQQVVDVMIGMLDQEPGPHGGKASLWRLLTRPSEHVSRNDHQRRCRPRGLSYELSSVNRSHRAVSSSKDNAGRCQSVGMGETSMTHVDRGPPDGSYLQRDRLTTSRSWEPRLESARASAQRSR